MCWGMYPVYDHLGSMHTGLQMVPLSVGSDIQPTGACYQQILDETIPIAQVGVRIMRMNNDNGKMDMYIYTRILSL